MREIDRIIKTYQEYDARGDVQSRRDPRNLGNVRMAMERSAGIINLLGRRSLLPLVGKRILDIGCGSGEVLASLMRLGAEPSLLCGIDLLPDRIEAARSAWPDVNFRCGNAEHLEFGSDAFHMILLFTVFSSILRDELARGIALEVRRVLKPGGVVLWYDMRYNNPQNPHVRGMTGRAIRRLFADFEIELVPITLLPILARRLGRFTPWLYPILAGLRPLRTHYLGLLVKPIAAKRDRGGVIGRATNA